MTLVEHKKAMANTTKMSKCKNCGGRNCDFEQKQTRGGDEPMTITITCQECNFVERSCDISPDTDDE